MIERKFGRILFISSVAAFTGGVVGAHYAASKAGLHGLMHHLAPRVAADGVTVNSLAPALVGETKMFPADLETGTPRYRSLSAASVGPTRWPTWQWPCCATAI